MAKAELDRYLHYYQRFHNHDQSGRFAAHQAALTEQRMLELQSRKDVSWIDVQFLKAATDQVAECRRVLKVVDAQSEAARAAQPDDGVARSTRTRWATISRSGARRTSSSSCSRSWRRPPSTSPSSVSAISSTSSARRSPTTRASRRPFCGLEGAPRGDCACFRSLRARAEPAGRRRGGPHRRRRGSGAGAGAPCRSCSRPGPRRTRTSDLELDLQARARTRQALSAVERTRAGRRENKKETVVCTGARVAQRRTRKSR